MMALVDTKEFFQHLICVLAGTVFILLLLPLAALILVIDRFWLNEE